MTSGLMEVTPVSDEYSWNECDECGEELCQVSGDWVCPDCEDSSFELVPESNDEFIV